MAAEIRFFAFRFTLVALLCGCASSVRLKRKAVGAKIDGERPLDVACQGLPCSTAKDECKPSGPGGALMSLYVTMEGQFEGFAATPANEPGAQEGRKTLVTGVMSDMMDRVLQGEFKNNLMILDPAYMEHLRTSPPPSNQGLEGIWITGSPGIEGMFERVKIIKKQVNASSVAYFIQWEEDHATQILLANSHRFVIAHNTTSGATLDQSQQHLIWNDGPVWRRAQERKVTIAIYDNVVKDGSIVASLLPKSRLVKLKWLSGTKCSLGGTELLQWFHGKLLELGFVKSYLEDDARLSCKGPSGEEGEEGALRILGMLRANSPVEGESFYEAKGYKFMLSADLKAKNLRLPSYDEAKRVLDMPTEDLVAILKCWTWPPPGVSQEDDDELSLKKQALDVLSGRMQEKETVFGWLKRHNDAGRKGSFEDCNAAYLISRLFWHETLNPHSDTYKSYHMLGSCPDVATKQRADAAMQRYHLDLYIFTLHWPDQLFLKDLTVGGPANVRNISVKPVSEPPTRPTEIANGTAKQVVEARQRQQVPPAVPQRQNLVVPPFQHATLRTAAAAPAVVVPRSTYIRSYKVYKPVVTKPARIIAPTHFVTRA